MRVSGNVAKCQLDRAMRRLHKATRAVSSVGTEGAGKRIRLFPSDILTM